MTNPHSTLGTDPNSTPEEIHRAYRKKAKTSHPDSPTGSNEKFNALTLAYNQLINPNRPNQSPPPDQILQDALELISALVNQAADNGNPYINPFKKMQSNLNAGIQEIDNLIANTNNQIKLTKKYQSKIKYKGTKQNYILSILNSRISNFNNSIRTAKNKKKILKKALSIIKEYDFETEEFPYAQQSPSSTRNHSQFFDFKI